MYRYVLNMLHTFSFSLSLEMQKMLCTGEMAMTTMAIVCGWSSPGVEEVGEEVAGEVELGLPEADTVPRPGALSTGS